MLDRAAEDVRKVAGAMRKAATPDSPGLECRSQAAIRYYEVAVNLPQHPRAPKVAYEAGMAAFGAPYIGLATREFSTRS